MITDATIPPAARARYPAYLRVAREIHVARRNADPFGPSGAVTSAEISAETGIESSCVRRDLSYLGRATGRRLARPKLGYELDTLVAVLEAAVPGAKRTEEVVRNVVVAGEGPLAEALADRVSLLPAGGGWSVAAVTDARRRKTEVVAGIRHVPLRELPTVAADLDVVAAILAGQPAEQYMDACAAAGIAAVVSCLPAAKAQRVPAGITVRRLALEDLLVAALSDSTLVYS